MVLSDDIHSKILTFAFYSAVNLNSDYTEEAEFQGEFWYTAIHAYSKQVHNARTPPVLTYCGDDCAYEVEGSGKVPAWPLALDDTRL